jgi:hypothetical protein
VRSKVITFCFAFLLLLAYFAFLINVLLSYDIHKSFYSHIHLVEFVEIVLTQSIHRSSFSYNYYLEVWKSQTFQFYWLSLIFAYPSLTPYKLANRFLLELNFTKTYIDNYLECKEQACLLIPISCICFSATDPLTLFFFIYLGCLNLLFGQSLFVRVRNQNSFFFCNLKYVSFMISLLKQPLLTCDKVWHFIFLET